MRISISCDRFPYWFGLPDPRDVALAERLGELRSELGEVQTASTSHPCPFLLRRAFNPVVNSSRLYTTSRLC